WGWWRRLRTAVLRSVAIMGIALAGFAVPVWLVPNYLRNNVFVTLFGGPGNAEVIRPALSWNFAIFLWILGGVWLVAYVVLFYRRTIGRALQQSRGVVLALSVVAVFSFLIWPRAARMFAVVMPFAILLFGRIVQWLYESPADEHGNGQSVRRRTWAFAGAVVVLCVLVARGFVAGSCYTAPTGIRKVNQFIARDSRTVPDTLFGTYVEPLFTLGVTPGRQWRQVPAYMWSDMQWVCSGDIIDEMILEEVFAHGTVPVSWRTHQTHMLDKFRQEPRIAQFPNDFYASKWYLSEAAIEDSYLTFMLRRAAEIKEPMWHLHFVGGLAGDSLRTPVVSDSAATLP
ncbi:MAG TPA: hypothetical protein VLB27_02165, partial [candidate division Zixibacteria bacterium]|nr:hypothetical protein [candidate division Zixibacteria bacterium]